MKLIRNFIFFISIILFWNCTSDGQEVPIVVKTPTISVEGNQDDSADNNSNESNSNSDDSNGNSNESNSNSEVDLNDYNFNDVLFTTELIGFIVGEGIVLKTINGGNDWQIINKNLSINFTSVTFNNSIEGFIGGNDQFHSYVFKTENGGLTWSQIGLFSFSNERTEVIDIFSINDGNKVVLLINNYPNATQSMGSVYFTEDSGLNWKKAQLNHRNPGLSSGDVVNDKIIISSKTYWTGYKYESRLYSNSFFQNSNIDFEDSKTRLDIELNDLDMCQKYGYAVGEMGNYLISTNYGLDWTQKNIANYSEVSITNVKFYNDSTGIVTTMNGDFLKTNDYGITWEKILSLNENEITDFEIKNSSIYIIGKNGFTTEIDLDI